MMQTTIERVLAALEDIRAGKMVIVVDDEDRENEGDLVMAADLVTPDAINFMAKYARGLICLSLTGDRIELLELPMMVDENQSSRTTAFTVSIEARVGVTTGISAADRARTIQAAVAPDAKATDIVSPGHVFPLRAVPGGVLQRTGHTEGSVDLARLAGRFPAGVICEIMKDDGTMARYPDLVEFAEKHGLRLISIADLIPYRLARERLVEKLRQEPVTLDTGVTWQAHVYDVGKGKQFLAMTLGTIDQSPTLVRMHTGSVLGDVFRVSMGNRLGIDQAIHRIESEGRGAIVFLPGDADPSSDIAYLLGEAPRPRNVDKGEVLREYGLGAQVLADLGLGKMRILTNRPRRIPSVDAYGLEVVEQIMVREEGA